MGMKARLQVGGMVGWNSTEENSIEQRKSMGLEGPV